MAIITIAQVLACAEDFEHGLSEFYAKISHETSREGVRLLTDYMSRHRQRTHAILDKLPVEERHRIWRIPLRYEPQGIDFHCFLGVELAPDSSAAEVLDAAVAFDECLIRLYRQVLRQQVDQKVKDMFEGLIRMEVYDEIELKKIKAENYF